MIKIIEERVRKTKLGYKILFYGSMGVLWSLANIGYSFGILAWFALVPLLFLLRFETIKRATFFSSIFGFAFYITNFYWLTTPFLQFFSRSNNIWLTIFGGIQGAIVSILISYFHGLNWSLAVFLTKYLSQKKGEHFYVFFPLIMTAVDYFFPKLWYDQIGYSQYIFIGFSQIADIFGVPVITLIILICNASINMIVENIFFKKPLHGSIFTFISVILIIITASIYGSLRIDNIRMQCQDAPSAKIAVVQGNISGLDKMNKEKRSQIIPTYNELTKSVLDQSVDLVIWPESAIGRSLSTGLLYFDSIKSYSGAPLLFGTNTIFYDHQHFADKYYNSLYLISDENELIDRYDKIKLLPFTEEIPFAGMNWIMSLYGLHPFTRGEKYKIFKTGNLKIAPNICYEDIMPDFIRKSLNIKNSNKEIEKANIIINGSNDSWFGSSPASKMHMHIAIFRAIENKRSLIRATCTGNSIICDPSGQIKHQTNNGEKVAFVEKVSLLSCDTIYNKGGWTFVYIIALIDFIILIYQFISRWWKKQQLQKLLEQKRHNEKLYQTWID